MPKSRTLLLTVSCALVVLVLVGGLGLKVGAATDGSYGGAVLFSEIFYLVMENYVDPLESGGLLVGAYEGMLGGLDARGAYLSPEEVAWWKGVGERGNADPGVDAVKQFGILRVVYVEADSPAERAGIAPGDHIRSVDDMPVRDMSLDQALLLLRGEPGSTVRLGLMHPAADFTREEVTVERAERRALGWDLEVFDDIAVLQVRDLDRVRSQELRRELSDVRSRGFERLLVDLRDVVELDPRRATPLLEPFLSGPGLELRDRGGQVRESLRLEERETAWPGDLAVLVNGFSTGAAEAAALLLQAGRGARVYGQTTYGLGSEPSLFELEDGGGLLVSTGVWQTTDGRVWNQDGVEPDQTIEGEGESLEENRASQFRRALEAFRSDLTAVEQKAA